MELRELEKLRKYDTEAGLIKIVQEIDDKVTFREYDNEQVLKIVNEIVKIDLLSVRYETREEILHLIYDILSYHDIHHSVDWENIIGIKDKLEEDLQEYVTEFIEASDCKISQAILKNFYTPQQIVFVFGLIKSDSLIYKKDQADYLNWFPCDFRLYVEDKLYSFRYSPTLSLEGLKNFMKIMEDVVKEKEAFSGSENPDMEFNEYEYCATEGEFTIILQNLDEEGEDIVETTLWLNAAYYAGDSVGYYQGFRFYVRLEDLKTFLLNIRNQLNEIISE